MNTKPLVSIVVITYNSADYVVETLNSIKDQNYDLLELIISDDGSKDNTVKRCREWLLLNKERFQHTEVLEVSKNTGISANLQRGVDKCKGTWIKPIAGDDLLLPDCISIFLEETDKYKQCSCFISKMLSVQNNQIKQFDTSEEDRLKFAGLSVEKKYKLYTYSTLFLNTPTIFIKKDIYKKYKLIDATYNLLEDQPLFFGLLKNKEDVIYINKPTVVYRIHGQSVSGGYNKGFYQNLYKAFLEFRKPYMNGNLIEKIYRFSLQWTYYFHINRKEKDNFIVSKVRVLLHLTNTKCLSLLKKSLYN